MSLTSFLEQADVRAKFREVFPKPGFTQTAPLIVPPQSKNYSIIGTAFDYLLRFHLEYWLSQKSQKLWVAFNALPRIAASHNRRLLTYAQSALELAKDIHEEFLKTGNCTQNLLYTCLKLAQFDSVFRATHVSPELILETSTKAEAKELQDLIQIVPANPFGNAVTCFLNPTFNEASVMIGGADADIIVDDILVEIKTTKKLELEMGYYHQLMGYYTLYRLAGISGDTEAREINHVGIYYSRYAYFYTLEVKTLFDESKFINYLNWFVQRANKHFYKNSEKDA